MLNLQNISAFKCGERGFKGQLFCAKGFTGTGVCVCHMVFVFNFRFKWVLFFDSMYMG